MVETATKLPVKAEKSEGGRESAPQSWRPLETLHRQVDQIFDAFQRDFRPASFHQPFFGLGPLLGRDMGWGAEPAVDIIESDKAYQVTADLPGMDEKNIEVKLANGALMIKGEKQEEREEKKKNHYLQERRFGSFERRFRLPDGIDAEKIEASFKKGVLTVTLPKTPEAQKAVKKIAVKAG
ncbi:MAG: Hsp20/alpha crystallin family protein [Rhizobiales bacterium]|nr:Hsp20/alpha crystallin family protein [Hyphomicrobiales bacterium]MBI3672030.1 Hsp20/alpha crystallin family protein [Hyphomicrobiales bacterium]